MATLDRDLGERRPKSTFGASGWTSEPTSTVGATKGLIARMVGNIALDTVVGSIPVLGSIFDVYFKANRRNIRLLKDHLDLRRL